MEIHMLIFILNLYPNIIPIISTKKYSLALIYSSFLISSISSEKSITLLLHQASTFLNSNAIMSAKQTNLQRKVRVSTLIKKMDINIKEIGQKIYNTDMELNITQMVTYFKVILCTEVNSDKENIISVMVENIKEITIMVQRMGKVFSI